MKLFRKIFQKKWAYYLFCVFIALLLEIFLFNFKTFESLGYQPFTVSFDAVMEMEEDVDGYSFSKAQAYGHITSEFTLHNITFVTDPVEDCLITQYLSNGQELGSNQERLLTVRLAYNGTDFEDAQTEAIPLYTDAAYRIRLSGARDVHTLDLLFENPYENAIHIREIRCNEKILFHFSLLRFAIVALFLSLLVAFRKSSRLWKIKLFDKSRWNILILIFCIATALVFLSLFYLNNITSATIPAVNSYGKLAEALANGSVSVLEKPSDALMNLSNPYDVTERTESGAEYLWDFAYYKNSYYVYFGIVPCLIFFLPYYFITKSVLSYSLVFSIFTVGFIISLSLCIWAFLKRYFKEVSLGAYLLIQLVTAFGCGFLYVAGHATTYGIPQVSAVMFVLLGIFFYFKAAEEETIRIKFLIAGSFMIALSAGCRPHIVLYGLLAFPVLKDKMLAKKTGRAWVAFLSPLLLVATLLMIYNYIRFGSLFEFGASYNLTMHNVYGASVNGMDLLAAFVYYLFTLPKVTGDFPVFDRVSPSYIPVGDRFTYTDGGFFWFVPVLLLGFFYFSKKGRKQRLWQIICLMTGMVLLCIDASSLAARYAFDFLPVLLMASWGPMAYICMQPQEGKKKYILRNILVVLCIYIIIVAVLGYFTLTKGGGLMTDVPEKFYRIRKWILFWT